ncbi:sphingosine N-acyltransferase lag1 [Lodderomyces elongisporus]|nr:sphingosine N-acyltransferase lag1 [Lodderomyces elongisporus]WLF76455.1 sphingosine N-acyltransferase lag1 [Lodderomyces elongisporus]
MSSAAEVSGSSHNRQEHPSLAHKRHRSSSVGEINVGDTSASLSTMPTSSASRRRSDARLMQLSSGNNSDFALAKKLLVGFRELTYRQTWILPLIVLVASFFTYYLSSPSGKVHKFMEDMMIPSYHIEGTDQYGKGANDFKFVGFYAIFFTFLREFMMCCILKPISIFLGIKKEAKQKRFMEQTYAMFYYGISGPFGLWIMSKTPLWFFETTPFYLEYPHKTHEIFFKVFYLGQAAFWVQQSVVLILQLEKPRKDFKELVLHHIITIALIWCSYRFHFTWMGIAVFITMDVSDFFLAISKTLNYLDSSLTGPFFVLFIGVWIYLRHYINLRILWSVLTEFRTVGEWELNWETQQYKCYISQPITFFLIFALQLVNIYWLILILRILYRYIFSGDKKDERSDDEEEEEEVVEAEKKQQ